VLDERFSLIRPQDSRSAAEARGLLNEGFFDKLKDVFSGGEVLNSERP
jgi:hypothetical protein